MKNQNKDIFFVNKNFFTEIKKTKIFFFGGQEKTFKSHPQDRTSDHGAVGESQEKTSPEPGSKQNIEKCGTFSMERQKYLTNTWGWILKIPSAISLRKLGKSKLP